MRPGARLGAACYGTLGVTNGWSLHGFSPLWTAAIVDQGAEAVVDLIVGTLMVTALPRS